MLKCPSIGEVFVYVSDTNGNFTGHVSIEINCNGQTEYISFYSMDLSSRIPATTPCGHFLNSRGKLVQKEDDGRHLDKAVRYEIQDLDVYAMFAKAAEFKRRVAVVGRKKTESISSASIFAEEIGSSDEDDDIVHKLKAEAKLSEEKSENYTKSVQKELRFGIFGKHNHLCSTIVFELLETGNVQKKIPYYANIFDPRHLFFLSLRPSISIVSLTPVFSSFLFVEEEKRNNFSIFVSAVALTLQLFVIVYCEHMFDKRNLFEVSGASFVVKFFALVGFCASSLSSSFFAQKIGLELELWQHPFLQFVVDCGVWLLLGFFGFWVAGSIASAITYLFCGLRAVVRPSGLKCMLEFLEETQKIPDELLVIFFKRESTNLFMVLASLLGEFAFWDEVDDPAEAFFLDGGLCLLAVSIVAYFVNVRFFPITSTIEFRGANLSPDSRPFQIALLTYCTGSTIALATNLTGLFVSRDLLINCAVSIPAAFFGYVIGSFLSSNLAKLSNPAETVCNHWAASFFSTRRYSVLSQERIQDDVLSIEEHLRQGCYMNADLLANVNSSGELGQKTFEAVSENYQTQTQ